MGNGLIEAIQVRIDAFRDDKRRSKRFDPDFKQRLAQRSEAKLRLIAKLKKQVRQV